MTPEKKNYNLTIRINNFHLSYDDVGKGAIPIIFLHGFPFDKSMWQGQVDFLKDNFRLMPCDIRGFGKSMDEDSDLSMTLFADDLIGFMDALSIERAVICGLSMGGFIALNAVERFPERFEALILCDTQCIADTPEVKEKRYQTIEDIERGGLREFNEGFIKKVFHKDSIAHKKDLVAQLSTVVFNNSEHIIKQGLIALAERSETCTMLKDISMPTLIICGRQDEVTPLAESEKMHASIEGSILKIIENAGHVSNLEQPEVFNEHLLEFLQTLAGLDFEKVNGDERMA